MGSSGSGNMSQALGLMKSIMSGLENGEEIPLDLWRALPVEGLPPGVFSALLADFCNLAAANENLAGLKQVISRWEIANGEITLGENEALFGASESSGTTDRETERETERETDRETERETPAQRGTTDGGIDDPYNLPVRALLFTLPQVSEKVLRMVAANYPDKTLVTYLLALLKGDSLPETRIAAERLLMVYPPQDYPLRLWQELAQMVEELEADNEGGNAVMREFINEQLREHETFAPKPEWVQDFGLDILGRIPPGLLPREELALPSSSELEPPSPPPVAFCLPSVEEAVNILTARFQRPGARAGAFIDEEGIFSARLEEEREKARDLYIRADRAGRVALLRPVMAEKQAEELSLDDTLHRILGPAHPTAGARFDEAEASPCAHHGGCRMFTCVEFENYDEYGIVDEDSEGVIGPGLDWFTESCDHCFRRIRHRHWAVRKPLMYGGWKGCFCSWKCVAETIEDPREDLIIGMAGYMEAQMKMIGIQDRREEM